MPTLNTYRDGTGVGFIRIGDGNAYRSHYIKYLGNGLYSITRDSFHLSYAESFDHAMSIIDNLLDD